MHTGAAEGAVRWTIYGLLTCTTMHFTWPWFRKQTLAGKGFIVSSFTIFGLVTWADHYLISYEKEERQANERLRRAAQHSLASSGKIASESNIKSWLRDNRERQVQDFQADYAKARGASRTTNPAAAAAAGGAPAASAASEAGPGEDEDEGGVR